MGGALILLSVSVSTLLWADLSNRFVWIVLLVTLGFGAVGWVDDWRKVVRNPKGLSARRKILLAIPVIAAIAAIFLALCRCRTWVSRLGDLLLTWIQGRSFDMELPPKGGPLIVPFSRASAIRWASSAS